MMKEVLDLDRLQERKKTRLTARSLRTDRYGHCQPFVSSFVFLERGDHKNLISFIIFHNPFLHFISFQSSHLPISFIILLKEDGKWKEN